MENGPQNMTEIGEQTCQHWNWSRNNFGPLNEILFPGFDGLSSANEPSGTLAIRIPRKGGMVHTTHANRCTGRTGSHWVRCWASVEGTSWGPNIPKMRKIKRNDRGSWREGNELKTVWVKGHWLETRFLHNPTRICGRESHDWHSLQYTFRKEERYFKKF